KYMDKYAAAMIISIILAIVAAVTTILGPDMVKVLSDEIQDNMMTGIDTTKVINIAIGIMIVYLISVVFGYLQQFIMATITQKTAKRLRTDVDQKLYRLPLAYFDRNTKGDILSKVTNDVDTIAQSLSQSIANLFSAVVLFIGLLIMMFISNWVLAIVTIVSSMLGMFFIPVILKKSQNFFRANQRLLGKMNGQIEEVYTNHNIVKAFNAVDDEMSVFSETNDALRKSNWRASYFSGLMQPIMIFVGNLSYVLIFFV